MKRRFEYIYSFLILLVLTIALLIFRNDKDIVNIIITTLVGGLSAITTFYFTKHIPREGSDDEEE